MGAQNLKSGDWMIPSKRDPIENALNNYFTAACAVSLDEQARFLQELTHDACATNFAFAGFVETNGRPVLRPVGPFDPRWSDPDYWGWDSHTASVTLLFRKTSGGKPLDKIAEPLPFTPLFVFKGDRQKLVNRAAKDSGVAKDAAYPPSQVEAILPLFFRQSRE